MGDLVKYNTLIEKEQFYNCIKIETEQEFDERFDQIQTDSEGCAFRSLNEAKFKLYPSAQRRWIEKDLFKVHSSFSNYILRLIDQTQQNRDVISFFQDNNIPINDFVILALLQHYRKPSPLIDFTYNPLIALFFAFDEMKIANTGTIDDYVSIYRINYDQPCFCSIQEVNVYGGITLETELQEFNAVFPISKIDTSSVTRDISNLSYSEYSNVGHILIHGDKMGITNISIPALRFFCSYNITNPNLKNQEGLFILNTSEDKPLGELLKEKHRCSSPLIDCFNIRKNLKLYIQSKYLTPHGIDCNMIYPNDNDSQNIKNWLAHFDKNGTTTY
jgi:hypothetical protein